MAYERHPLSASWPDMADEDFIALKDSIAYSGLLEPITVFEGQILDGWHRYCACLDTGIEPRFEEFTGDDPAQYVRDKHTRRPLTLTQRLTCIALMSRWRPRGGKQSAVPADCSSSKDIAKAAGGGVRSAEHVKEAITKGAPELVQAMKDGKVGAEKAAAIAKMPKEEQAAAIHKPTPKAAPEAPPAPANHELQEAAQAINELAAENDQLRDRVAVAAMSGTDEERAQAADTIAELREQVKTLEAELDATRTSRDGFQRHNAELMKQVRMLQKQNKKLEG